MPRPSEGYTNLSSVQLSKDEQDFLNLGINHKIAPKYDLAQKKAELEILYQDVLSLRGKRKIDVNPNIKEQLMAESTKDRSRPGRRSLSPRLLRAAKELKRKADIQIRKADKSNTYVILDKSEYLSKTDAILADTAKFKKISRNPIEELKRKTNDLITAANKAAGSSIIPRVTGDYQPGYMYGNVKTHKPGNPLRPIISQIPLPTYDLAKKLNNMLSKFVPDTYAIKSPCECVDMLRARKPQGMLASLDVANLFTNVPVEQTIAILCDHTYRHPHLDPPAIPETIMAAMLRLCTTQVPFRCPRGNLYCQTDGVSMGSPLGVLFAQAYMGSVEAEVLKHSAPDMYCRYIDDILVSVSNKEELESLRYRLQAESCLTFTVEESVESQINFLDISIDASTDSFITAVFRKSTDSGRCLSGKSECPDRYKASVVKAYVLRALKHCSSWPLVVKELKHIKQMLSNNRYPAAMVDREISHALNKYMQHTPEPEVTSGTNTPESTVTNCTTGSGTTSGTTYTVYYRNIMNAGWKMDEKVLKRIVKNNCTPVNTQDRLVLSIYYRSPSTSNLIMSNNPNRDTSLLKQTNVVYFFKCKKADCELLPRSGYVGVTTTSMSRRITMHLQAGGPKTHTEKVHGTRLTRHDMTSSMQILAATSDKRRLQVLEAIYIRQLDPSINAQVNAQGTLLLYDGPQLAHRIAGSSPTTL